jgi:hypothetical protein
MNCGQVYQSIAAWGKLASFPLTPRVALKVLRYVKLVEDEHAVIEKQRNVLIRDITKTEEGADVSIKEGTAEYSEFVVRFGELLLQESELPVFDESLDYVLEAVASEDCALTVTELSQLESFFSCGVTADEPEAQACG